MKALLKQNPAAELIRIRKGEAVYAACINVEGEDKDVTFSIPVNDMGDADFLPWMDSKLLNRWIVEDKIEPV